MFSITAQDGLARCGTLLTRHAAVTTPSPMLYTRRGGTMFLTPDMMELLKPEAQMVQVNVMQFVKQPTAELLAKYGKGVGHYVGIPKWPILASNRDPCLTEYVGSKPSKNEAAYVTIHTGGTTVTPEHYMAVIKALQPDLYVAMADEVPAEAGKKRVATSVDRTAKWLDSCLEHHASLAAAAAAAGADEAVGAAPAAAAGAAAATLGPQLLAPVVGCCSKEQRERSAQEAAKREVAGFALCGFGMGEVVEAQAEALAAAMVHLPAEKPKLAVGLGSVEQVVDAVARGVDLFDSSYPLAATNAGYALCFPWDQEQESTTAAAAAGGFGAGTGSGPGSSPSQADLGADDSKVNLWSLEYRLDKGPLVPGCRCFTCQNHSRGYIHHLLHTHEMLASILLDMHNTHWWLGLFEALRKAIRAGQLGEYQAWSKGRRERWLQHQQQQGVAVEDRGISSSGQPELKRQRVG